MYGASHHRRQFSHSSGHKHASHHHGAPPPGADPQVWHWFSTVDADRSGYITANELQTALVNGKSLLLDVVADVVTAHEQQMEQRSGFDLDTVKMLMQMFDKDHNGSIGFKEFTGLWKYIADWQNVFLRFDRDRSGSIDGRELTEALRSFGYNLSPSLLTSIEHKYGPTSEHGPPPGITFDRFVRACVTVKMLTDSFQRLDTDRDGWIRINYEQFMSVILNAP